MLVGAELRLTPTVSRRMMENDGAVLVHGRLG